MRCRATKKAFTALFGIKLKWRTMKIGSWELFGEGKIPDNIAAKEILLHTNILFPRNFIKNWRIKKNK